MTFPCVTLFATMLSRVGIADTRDQARGKDQHRSKSKEPSRRHGVGTDDVKNGERKVYGKALLNLRNTGAVKPTWMTPPQPNFYKHKPPRVAGPKVRMRLKKHVKQTTNRQKVAKSRHRSGCRLVVWATTANTKMTSLMISTGDNTINRVKCATVNPHTSACRLD